MDPNATHPRGSRLLRVIGALKLLKSLLFVALGLALLRWLGDEELQRRAIDFVSQLRPGRLTHLAERLVQATGALSDAKRKVIVGGAFGYAIIFAVEGVGLLLLKTWAEWLTVVSTGLLIPFEIYEIVERPTPVRIVALVANAAVLAYLIARRVKARPQMSRPID